MPQNLSENRTKKRIHKRYNFCAQRDLAQEKKTVIFPVFTKKVKAIFLTFSRVGTSF